MQSEKKKNIQGTNSEGEETGTQINALEQKEEINIQPEQNEEKKNRRGLGNLWDNFKCANIQTIGVPTGEEEEQEIENLFEKILKENFPNLVKEIDLKVQEAQRVPNKLDPKRNTPRHIIITLAKMKFEKILKAAKGKKPFSYKGIPIRLSANFSKEILQARKGWKDIFNVMKGKNLHPRLLYPAKLSFRMEGKMKCFSERSS